MFFTEATTQLGGRTICFQRLSVLKTVWRPPELPQLSVVCFWQITSRSSREILVSRNLGMFSDFWHLEILKAF